MTSPVDVLIIGAGELTTNRAPMISQGVVLAAKRAVLVSGEYSEAFSEWWITFLDIS
jgi:hypothetical protein